MSGCYTQPCPFLDSRSERLTTDKHKKDKKKKTTEIDIKKTIVQDNNKDLDIDNE